MGYDDSTDGFIALQKGHQPSALPFELPMAEVLKKQGHAVVLLSETNIGKKIDATIDGELFDFKNMVTTHNLYGRMRKYLLDNLKKGTPNIAIYIELAVSNETILEVLRRLALNPETKEIEKV